MKCCFIKLLIAEKVAKAMIIIALLACLLSATFANGIVWSSPQEITNGDMITNPSIAVDTDGNWHIVYREYNGGHEDCNITYINSLSESTMLAASLNLAFPSIATGSDGVLHVVYTISIGIGVRSLMYMNNVSGSWSSPQEITNGDMIAHPSIAVDKDGNWHIVYREHQASHEDCNITYINSLFESTRLAASLNLAYPSIATGSDGVLHVVYPIGIGIGVYSLMYTKAELPRKITCENFNFACISEVANEFTVWLDINSPTLDLYVDDYEFKIVDRETKSNVYATQYYIAEIQGGDPKRWKISFQVESRHGQMNTPYFEGGILQISRRDGSMEDCTVPESELLLSVYGTDFSMVEHAYPFENGSWNLPDKLWMDDYFKAGDTVDDYLDSKKDDFWKSVGYRTIGDGSGAIHDPGGLCYGMAHSSIANYTHGFETNHWGEANETTYAFWNSDSDNSWQEAIDKRWPEDQSEANPPNKPFSFNNLYLNTEEGDNWTLETCKKITYYFCTQEYFESDGWPGEDFFTTPTVFDMVDQFRTGNPIGLHWGYDSGGHAVVITQMICWNDRITMSIYNNNDAFGKYSGLGSFQKWDLPIKGENLDYRNHRATFVNIDTGESSGGDGPFDSFGILDFEGDSQNIYIHPKKGDFYKSKEKYSHFQWSTRVKELNNILESGYIEITAIGANNAKVFNHSTSEEIPLVQAGELDGTEAV